MTQEEDIPGARTCSLGVTRGVLERLHYDEEPGRGFTQASLREHIAECEECRARMSLIARRDKNLKEEYERFSERMAALAKDHKESRRESDTAYEEYRREAERLRSELIGVESNSMEGAKEAETASEALSQTFAELNIYRTRARLREKQAVADQVAPLVASVVTVLNQILKMENGPKKLTLLETLAAVCKESLKAVAPDPEKLLTSASGVKEIRKYPLNDTDTLEIALLVASNPKPLRKSEQPILTVGKDALVFDQVAYAAAAGAV